MRARLPQLVAALALLALAAGCHFSVGGLLLPYLDGGTDDLGTDDFGDMPPVTMPDLAGLCSNGGAMKACSGDGMSLLVCMAGAAVPTPCANGCSSVGDPHCASLDPSGVVAPSDYLDPALLIDVDVSGTAAFNSETGEISAPPLVRGPGTGVDAVSGVGFRSVPQPSGGPDVGVFTFRSLNVAASATINVVGTHPIAFVAQNDINFNGRLDLQGSCMAGANVAGGGAGGLPKNGAGNVGGGMGGGGAGGSSPSNGGGGGGGGYGEVGGGGAGGATLGGSIGALFGDLTQDDPILVGGGGGGAGGGSMMNQGGHGGSGGGFAQLVSGRQITIGATSVLHAGGCHGFPANSGNGGGGGGGAGGGILIESTTVTLTSGATIVANGGAGAGGDTGDPGGDGQDDATVAKGGQGNGAGTDGGDGGHTGMIAGAAGVALVSGDHFGGGGGGGVGRIAIKTKAGTVTTTGVTFSPKIAENLTGHLPPTTIGVAKYR